MYLKQPQCLATLTLLLSFLCRCYGDEGYSISPEIGGPGGKRVSRNPTRVEIYVMSAKRDVDRSSDIAVLKRKKPDAILTDASEIVKLLDGLRARPGKWRKGKLENREGFTYHLLVTSPPDNRVTHVRILHAGKAENSSGEVYPNAQSEVHYVHEQIGPLLREALKKKPTADP
jgi:hypothetical protein